MIIKKSLLFFIFILSGFSSFAQNTQVFIHEDLPYRTGLELYQKEKYVAAQEQFRQYYGLAKNDLKSIDCQYYMAMCSLYLGNENAESQIENFISQNPEYPKNQLAYIELGLYEFNDKNYDKAITYLKDVNYRLLSDEKAAEARYKLGYSLFSKQRYKESEELFNYLKKSQNTYTTDASYYSGYLAYQNQKYDQALTDLQKASFGNEYKTMVPYLICSVYAKQKKYDELISYGEKSLADKTVQNQEEIKLLVGDAYFRKEDFKKAVIYFQSYKGKLSADTQYRLGFAQYKTADYQNSIVNFAKIATQKDSLGQYAAYYLGLSYIQTGNKPFAIRALDESRKGKSKILQEEAVFLYAKVNYEQSNFTETISSLKNFNKNYPAGAHENEVNELLSDAYLDSDNYSEAVAHMESIKRKTPRINTAYQRVTYNKGVEFYNQDKFSESIVQFQKSLKNPVNEEVASAAMFWTAESQSALKQYSEAIKNYTFIIQNKNSKNTPYYVKSKYGLGYAYYNTKDYNRALTNFKEYVTSVKISPEKENYADALLRLGDCNYVTKDYNEAVKSYDLAIQQNIALKDYAYFQKGVVLGLNNRISEAKSALDNLIANYPNSTYYDDALFQKAEIDFEAANYKSAIEEFSKLITEKPESGFVPFALLKRATAYGNLTQYDNSIADYKRILTDFPTHQTAPDALAGVREALANANRSEEMPDILSAYKNADPKGGGNTETIEYEAAKDLYFGEKYQKAVQSLAGYLQSYPNSSSASEAKYYLADSYFRLDDKNNALKYYELVLSEKKSSNTPKAATRAAEISYSGKYYEKAIKNYRILNETARNKKDQLTAYTGLLNAYYELNRSDSTIYFAGLVIQNASGNPTVQNKAALLKGKVYYKQNELDKAENEFLELINTAQDESGAEAQYLFGEIQFKQKQYKQSLESLFKVNEKFGNFDKWRNKAFLLISENYVNLNESFQAKATLQSIIDNSEDKETVNSAKKRLKELEEK